MFLYFVVGETYIETCLISDPPEYVFIFFILVWVGLLEYYSLYKYSIYKYSIYFFINMIV